MFQVNKRGTDRTKQIVFFLLGHAKGLLSLGRRSDFIISDLQIGVRGRLRVLSSEHAHLENFRPPNLERVLSTENSSSYCNLKVALRLI